MNFEVTTVIVIMVIFGIFSYGAFKAEKVVAAKTKAQREAQTKSGAKHVAKSETIKTTATKGTTSSKKK